MHVASYLLQAGVAKLNEAKDLVDTLKKKAAEQSKILAEKQAEADKSLAEITETMKVWNGWCNSKIIVDNS